LIFFFRESTSFFLAAVSVFLRTLTECCTRALVAALAAKLAAVAFKEAASFRAVIFLKALTVLT
jgi:hypothetical protein